MSVSLLPLCQEGSGNAVRASLLPRHHATAEYFQGDQKKKPKNTECLQLRLQGVEDPHVVNQQANGILKLLLSHTENVSLSFLVLPS